MNFSKSKILFNRLNTLFESAENFGQKFSTLERDLFLQYMRELYEEVSRPDAEYNPPISTEKPVRTETSGAIIPVQSIKASEGTLEQVISSIESTSVHTIEKPQVFSQNNSNGFRASDTGSSKITEVRTESHDRHEGNHLKPEFEDLFNIDQGKEQDNRFGYTAISDIGRSMGINDRILTINELFKGNQVLFNECISRLNTFGTYDEAVRFLSNGFADKFEWNSLGRKAKAQVFLKLVKRRYAN